MYTLARSALFKLNAEKAHHLTLTSLKNLHKLGLIPFSNNQGKATKLMGLHAQSGRLGGRFG